MQSGSSGTTDKRSPYKPILIGLCAIGLLIILVDTLIDAWSAGKWWRVALNAIILLAGSLLVGDAIRKQGQPRGNESK